MESIPSPPALLFLSGYSFGDLCAQSARRLFPDVPVITAEPPGFGAALAAYRPGLVIWPVQKMLDQSTSVEVDLAARSAGAMYLPIVMTSTELLVGPLYGPQRSCAACWAIRQSHLSQGSATQKIPPVQPPSPHGYLLKPTLASLAVSAMLSLLYRERAPFTSPYFLYTIHSRQVRNGVLTSTHECVTCRQQLRSMEGGNVTLRELILTRVEARTWGLSDHNL